MWEKAKREGVEQRSKDLKAEHEKKIEEIEERRRVELKVAEDQKEKVEAQLKAVGT